MSDELNDDQVELRLLRILGPGHVDERPSNARFLAGAPEYRYAIHRRTDGQRVGRIHLRITTDSTILRAVGHSGFEVDEGHRRQGYASRALRLIAVLAQRHQLDVLWVLIAPGNVASRRTAERAGFALVDVVPASPEALGLGLESDLCRYAMHLRNGEPVADASPSGHEFRRQ